jgi:hypothetical protein
MQWCSCATRSAVATRELLDRTAAALGFPLPAGRIVAWDPDGLSDRAGDKAWNASFNEIAPSVEAWLKRWVGGSTQAEQMQDMMRQSMLDSIRQSRAHFAAMTPEQRAGYGLPEEGWEREIGGHLGFDGDELRSS